MFEGRREIYSHYLQCGPERASAGRVHSKLLCRHRLEPQHYISLVLSSLPCNNVAHFLYAHNLKSPLRGKDRAMRVKEI